MGNTSFTPFMPLLLLLCTLLLPAFSSPVQAEEEGSVRTLWPLFDYRASPISDYRVLHLLGPLLKFESKGVEREFALRPLLYRATDGEDERFVQVLYPLLTTSRSAEETNWRGLQFLDYRARHDEKEEGSRFTLFPFIFSRQGAGEGKDYFAFFPFGGKLLERFGRDEIRFTLFPLRPPRFNRRFPSPADDPSLPAPEHSRD